MRGDFVKRGVEAVKTMVATLVLFGASCAMANTVVVVRNYLPSSSTPCFTTLKNDEPVSGVELVLYQNRNGMRALLWKSVTSKDGTACSPELVDGQYEIYANLGRRTAEVDIQVNKNNDFSRFPMTLVLPDQLRAAAESPVKIWMQDFRGVAKDTIGAVIPLVKIEVFRKEADDFGDEVITEGETNGQGRFSVELKAGTYVAIFTYPGFNLTAFPFAIDPKGWKGLELTMQVGDSRTPPQFAELGTN